MSGYQLLGVALLAICLIPFWKGMVEWEGREQAMIFLRGFMSIMVLLAMGILGFCLLLGPPR